MNKAERVSDSLVQVYPYWECKYCHETFEKQTQGIEWQIHKIGHKLTEMQNELIKALVGEQHDSK